VELNDKRVSLLKQRQRLRNEIEELTVKIHGIKQKHHHHKTQNLLSEFLVKNTNDFVTINHDVNEDDALNKLDVSPSSDWTQRLQLVGKFYPYLTVENIATLNRLDGHSPNNSLFRIIRYSLVSPLLFKVGVEIAIESRTDSISVINITQNNIAQFSPSFSRILLTNYVPEKKIHLIMYGMNTLSKSIHKRVEMFYSLIRALPNNVDSTRFGDLTQTEELSDEITLFAMLKSVDTLTFTFTKDTHLVELTLHWEIVLSNTVTGECERNLSLSMTKENRLIDCKSLFIDLTRSYGLMNALKIILKNSLNIEL
jgi:central kinetochore subunit CTF19